MSSDSIIPNSLIKRCRVKPGSKVDLGDFATNVDQLEIRGDPDEDRLRALANESLQRNLQELADAQERLWAADTHSVLIILQAMDAAGKDGTIKHVMTGLNPQGCRVHSFKQPSREELDHTFLWRYQKAAPNKGEIVIFNRSHYEDVLVVRVHPELLKPIEGEKINGRFWKTRYDDINNFEEHLARNRTLILKFYLHLSRAEQTRRLLARLENPDKTWKFSLADLEERKYWKQYQRAFEKAIEATSTEWAPWHIIPADEKWAARALVANVISRAIDGLNLKWPKVSAKQKEALVEARGQLQRELKKR